MSFGLATRHPTVGNNTALRCLDHDEDMMLFSRRPVTIVRYPNQKDPCTQNACGDRFYVASRT